MTIKKMLISSICTISLTLAGCASTSQVASTNGEKAKEGSKVAKSASRSQCSVSTGSRLKRNC